MAASIFYSFITLLVMVNPIEAAAGFDMLTGGDTAERQAAVARRSTLVAASILIVFGFAGAAVLQALGIGFPAFKIAGGILLFKVGFDMVFAQRKPSPAPRQGTLDAAADPSVFPLAIPIITGPGALTAAVTLWAKAYEQRQALIHVVVLLVCVAVVFAITYATMRAAGKLTHVLGETGIEAVGRIVGIIIAAIATQLVVDGTQQLMPAVIRSLGV